MDLALDNLQWLICHKTKLNQMLYCKEFYSINFYCTNFMIVIYFVEGVECKILGIPFCRMSLHIGLFHALRLGNCIYFDNFCV